MFLTVHDDAEFVEAAQAAGGIGYVVKPRLATDLLTQSAKRVRGGPSFRRCVEPFDQDRADGRGALDPPRPWESATPASSRSSGMA